MKIFNCIKDISELIEKSPFFQYVLKNLIINIIR